MSDDLADEVTQRRYAGDAPRQVVHIGLWTLGLVTLASSTWMVVKTQGLVPMALGPITMVAVLGVSGYGSIIAIDRFATSGEADE